MNPPFSHGEFPQELIDAIEAEGLEIPTQAARALAIQILGAHALSWDDTPVEDKVAFVAWPIIVGAAAEAGAKAGAEAYRLSQEARSRLPPPT